MAAAGIAAVAVSGGDGATASGSLAWDKPPRLTTPETLPDDRILSGVIRNDSLRQVEIASKDFRVVDAGGEKVLSAAIFLEGFGRGLYNPVREPPQLPEDELTRTGLTAKLDPGKTVSLTVSWREAKGLEQPLRIEYEGGTLPVR